MTSLCHVFAPRHPQDDVELKIGNGPKETLQKGSHGILPVVHLTHGGVPPDDVVFLIDGVDFTEPSE